MFPAPSLRILLIGFSLLIPSDEAAEIFSGPQPGEEVPSLSVRGIRGDDAGQLVDLPARASNGPMLVVFFHERTRPAFGLTNAVVRFAESRAEQGMTPAIVYLTADATETENWLKAIDSLLPARAVLGISPDGQEGPGPWGLNRNAAVTVVVANKGKVTANFALRQPSLDVDGPGILQAIADVTGGGPVPDITQFARQQRPAEARRMNSRPGSEDVALDTKLRQFLRPVIDKSASDDDVVAAAGKLEQEAAKDAAFRARVARSVNRIIEGDKLSSYGTPKAQEFLAKWAAEFSEKVPEKE